jgi:hypothetical protein
MPFDRTAVFFRALKLYLDEIVSGQEGITNAVEEGLENLSFGVPSPWTPRRAAELGGTPRAPAPSTTNRHMLGVASEHDLQLWIHSQLVSVECELHVTPSART